MSLESEKKYHKKHEQLTPKAQVNTKELLNELSQKIAKEYGIDVSEVKKLINSKTETKLETLKSLVSVGKETIDTQSLQNVIRGAKDVVEKASKDKIEVLKGNLQEDTFTPKKDFYISSRFISKEIYARAKDPKNLTDNLLGAGIGIINSAEATVELLYKIGAWIIQTPYHVYLIVSGKWEYTKFKKI